MPILNNSLKRRIIELSKKYSLSHIGSCLTAVDLINAVFKLKRKHEPVILSCGHAGLALYCVLEKYYGKNAEEIFLHHGVHPDRCNRCGIDVSTGSLGQGLPIAVGMAYANRGQRVFCLVSDGEMMEGSIWEALRIIDELKLTNLKLLINANGWGAYREIDCEPLIIKLRAFGWGVIKNEDKDLLIQDIKTEIPNTPIAVVCITNPQFVELLGQVGHYLVLNSELYNQYINILNEV